MTGTLARSFWRFSLRSYRDPAVRAACLSLQDDCGADVNLLLYCCWHARRGRRLEARELRSAIAAVANWQERVVLPLRAARRGLSGRAASVAQTERAVLRKRAGALELAAERIENGILAAHAQGLRAACARVVPRGAAIDNLRSYLTQIGAASGGVNAARVESMVLVSTPAPAPKTKTKTKTKPRSSRSSSRPVSARRRGGARAG